MPKHVASLYLPPSVTYKHGVSISIFSEDLDRFLDLLVAIKTFCKTEYGQKVRVTLGIEKNEASK